MLFGQKVAATVEREDITTGLRATHLPNPPTIPVFTVRSFFGIILQTPEPMLGVTEVFGTDINQVRIIFADWPIGSTEDFPVQPLDTIILPQGRYPINGAKYFPGSHIEIFVNVQPTT